MDNIGHFFIATRKQRPILTAEELLF